MSKQFTTIAKIIIAIVSIVHLIFTSIHVKALLLLEHEMCGFAMFLFVLTGLVALFESTQIKPGKTGIKIATALICFAAIGLGIYLVMVYQNAIVVQRSLDVKVVNRAITFSAVIIGAYFISGALILIDVIKNR